MCGFSLYLVETFGVFYPAILLVARELTSLAVFYIQF